MCRFSSKILWVIAFFSVTSPSSPSSLFKGTESERGARLNLDVGIGSSLGSTNGTVDSGVGCGTIPMRPNQIIRIQSSNFGTGNYFNNEACTWTFTAKECEISVFCPCFSIPDSFGCLEDYLKIGHLHFHDKFCGENVPVGVYRATGDFITLRFRSDYKGTGKGFLCHVRCTPDRSADPVSPNVDCPNNTRNPFGIAN